MGTGRLIAFIIITTALLNSSLKAQELIDTAEFRNKWYQSELARVTLAPAALITGSLLLFDTDGGDHTIIHDIPGFESSLDDYLQFAPIPLVYSLDLIGVESRNDVLNQSLLLLKSELLMLVLVHPLKHLTSVPRPDGSGDLSFPSGHTAQAFVSATFMHKEFGRTSIWYSIGAYAMASTTGIFRILKNKHRLTDVLMGAGLGILATNIVYATHQNRWGREERKYSLLPMYRDKSLGLHLQLRL
ncbi:MAG: phosphatase PAP2 family protein [Bacteroidota bacterium]